MDPLIIAAVADPQNADPATAAASAVAEHDKALSDMREVVRYLREQNSTLDLKCETLAQEKSMYLLSTIKSPNRIDITTGTDKRSKSLSEQGQVPWSRFKLSASDQEQHFKAKLITKPLWSRCNNSISSGRVTSFSVMMPLVPQHSCKRPRLPFNH